MAVIMFKDIPERKQDEKIRNVLLSLGQRKKTLELVTQLYMQDGLTLKQCQSIHNKIESVGDAIKLMKQFNVLVEFKNKKIVIVGVDNGDECKGMVFSDRYLNPANLVKPEQGDMFQ